VSKSGDGAVEIYSDDKIFQANLTNNVMSLYGWLLGYFSGKDYIPIDSCR
jgi:hypothetical protein